ncbi:MAG TPA: hypothetical protein VGB92_12380 [Longimicrobium sp.]|jgi:hypothetical protein
MPLTIQIESVGDGLNAALYTLPGEGLHLDVGGRSRRLAWAAFRKAPAPKTLVISHFHLDHYVGLYEPASRAERALNLQMLIFPRLPEFRERREFAAALFATLTRVFGKETGSIEADFLRLVGTLNGRSWTYSPVSRGEWFQSEGRIYEVLWPPRVIDDETFSRGVGSVLRAFDQAREEDPLLNEIHSRVYDSNRNPFEISEAGYSAPAERGADHPPEASPTSDWQREWIPPSTTTVLGRLTQIANRLSLAFRSAEELLFLGDLEERELGVVAESLLTCGLTASQCLMTAHHGTHWHANMFGLSAGHAVSSLGQRLASKYCQQYSYISSHEHLTSVQGSYLARLPFR